MLNYLILGQDGSLGGYERADVLLCDLATNEEPKAIWRRTDELPSRFAPSSVDEVRRDMEEPLVSRDLVAGMERIEAVIDRL